LIYFLSNLTYGPSKRVGRFALAAAAPQSPIPPTGASSAEASSTAPQNETRPQAAAVRGTRLLVLSTFLSILGTEVCCVLMILAAMVGVHVIELLSMWVVVSLLSLWTPAAIDSFCIDYFSLFSTGVSLLLWWTFRDGVQALKVGAAFYLTFVVSSVVYLRSVQLTGSRRRALIFLSLVGVLILYQMLSTYFTDDGGLLRSSTAAELRQWMSELGAWVMTEADHWMRQKLPLGGLVEAIRSQPQASPASTSTNSGGAAGSSGAPYPPSGTANGIFSSNLLSSFLDRYIATAMAVAALLLSIPTTDRTAIRPPTVNAFSQGASASASKAGALPRSRSMSTSTRRTILNVSVPSLSSFVVRTLVAAVQIGILLTCYTVGRFVSVWIVTGSEVFVARSAGVLIHFALSCVMLGMLMDLKKTVTQYTLRGFGYDLSRMNLAFN
jgi:hypothetical protein